MANTLTGLVPTIYTALDVVSRELIGFIPNVSKDAKAESAALNQTVRSPVAPQNSLEDITPGNVPADSGDQTIGYKDVTITKSKAYPIRWTGEEQLSVSQFGTYNTVLAQQFQQGFRTLANAVEADLAALFTTASRATGTPGTTPFATANDLTDFAEVNRLLDENGAPATGRVMIVGSAARSKLEGKQSELFKVNEAGDAGAMLRQRQLRQLMGFTMGYSAGITTHTKGTGSGYLVNGAAAAGATSVAVDTGSGTILAGDLIKDTQSGAADGNMYVVGSALSGGSFGINKPGLIGGFADNDALTVQASYVPNMAFTPNALVLAARLPAMPEGGDDADDVMVVTDPVSGLSFQVAMYKQYRRVKYEIGLAWGTSGVKSEHLVILAG